MGFNLAFTRSVHDYGHSSRTGQCWRLLCVLVLASAKVIPIGICCSTLSLRPVMFHIMVALAITFSELGSICRPMLAYKVIDRTKGSIRGSSSHCPAIWQLVQSGGLPHSWLSDLRVYGSVGRTMPVSGGRHPDSSSARAVAILLATVSGPHCRGP